MGMIKTRMLVLSASSLLLGASVASAQTAPRFTAAQAEAGKEIFGRLCVVCHQADLQGGVAPPLSGTYFADSWGNKPVAQLIAFATENMPATAPGSLDQDSYLKLIAYILSFNGVPAGDAPLTADDPGVVTVVTKD